MKKNEVLAGLVSRLGSNGEGIIKNENYTIFIPYALPGEKVRFQVLKVNKNIVYGKMLEILTPAEDRIRPACPVFEKCGGCQLQHMNYRNQLKLKTAVVKDCLSKIAFINYEVPLTVKSDIEYGYRNKLQLPVRSTPKGNIIGFFAENSHRIVSIGKCAVQADWAEKVISAIKNYIETVKVPCFNEEKNEGLLKHVVLREVKEYLFITLVINGETAPHTEFLINELMQNFKNFSLFLNVNTVNSNVIMGDRFIHVFGEEKIVAEDMGISYEMGPESFMQINDNVKRKIYIEAQKIAETDKNTVVIDAYSGAGMLTALFAKEAKKAIGIEIVKEAVECADKVKEMNGLDGKMENICAACEDVLPDIIAKEKAENAKCVLVLDPPRQGVDVKVLEAVLKSKPEKIIYISCSPQTLSRDLGILLGTLIITENGLTKSENPVSGYKLNSVQPFDMFPQTKHVETVVLMSRNI